MHKLIDVLARRQVSQSHCTQIAQFNRWRQTLAEVFGHGPGQQNLAAMRRLHDPRCAIDGASEKVIVATLDDAEMQPGTYLQGEVVIRR